MGPLRIPSYRRITLGTDLVWLDIRDFGVNHVICSRRMSWTGHLARIGEKRNVYKVLVGNPEGKIPLGRPRHRWEDRIKIDLRVLGWCGRDWINLA
jgi:hypothetical protein